MRSNSFFFSQPVQPAVAEIEAGVDAHGDEVDDVEDHHIVEMAADEFAGNAEGVADQQEYFKDQAFPFGGAGHPGFVNGDGPGDPKADDHNHFKQLRHISHAPNSNGLAHSIGAGGGGCKPFFSIRSGAKPCTCCGTWGFGQPFILFIVNMKNGGWCLTCFSDIVKLTAARAAKKEKRRKSYECANETA